MKGRNMKRVFPLSRLSGVTVERMVKVLSLSFSLLALGTRVAWAGSICPGAPSGNNFPHPPDPNGTGCNVVITINADGSTAVSVKDSTPYENSEDIIVGIQNNSSSTVPALSITSAPGNDIFGFDGDGMCIYTFVGSSYCSAAQMAGTDPFDYQGPTSTFTNIGSNGLTGTVNFNPAISAGGSTYFSLEGQPSASLVVGVGPGGGSGTPSNVPTLSGWALALLAGLLMGSSLWMMRDKV
jgi:hypothetical protein